ncbi:MAG: hydroxypyruvate isomerase [Mariniblastus sp.]|jgi:hydroxypyruvate isomerase
MPQFENLIPSVCIDAVLGDKSLAESLKIVSDCGLPAFEFWCWWEKDLDQLVALQSQYGLQVAACCTKFISLVDPVLRDAYLAGLTESIEVAVHLGCPTLISQVGDSIPGRTRAQQQASLVEGLRVAAPALELAGITLVIEPLNEKVDHAGYYLIHSDEAFSIVDQVDSPNVKVVFDVYHQQISEGNLIPNIVANIDKIGHFHAAGQPGRNELSSGEINYPEIFAAIRSTSYQGYMGLEYWPKHDPVAGLQAAAKLF